MTMNKKKMNKYPIMHVSAVFVLTIALVTSTFAFQIGTRIGAASPRDGAPYPPSNPGPENESINVTVDADLNWTGGDPDGYPVTYNVYFSTINPPTKIADNITATNFGLSNMNYSTLYYWRIVAWNNQSESATGPLWQFTTMVNEPPNTPNNPFPKNGSMNVSVTASLNWTGGDPYGDTVTYDVYFGTMSPPEKVEANQSEVVYKPSQMNGTTTYYWMIIAWDDQGMSAAGEQWEFTTGVKPNSPPNTPSEPHPSTGATGVALDATLSWTGGDPDGDPVTYQIFWGTTNPPEQVVANQTQTTYDPDSMTLGTKYYWKIIAWDNHSASATGTTWSYTTVQGPSLKVNITKPVEGAFYFQDQARFNLPMTIVYGPITITAEVTPAPDVAYVLFIINDKEVFNDTSAPYEYLWQPLIQFNGLSLKHTIKVVAYSTQGKNASAEINVTKWRFHVLPWVVAGLLIASSLILHTKIHGFFFNIQQTRLSTTFFAIRARYTTLGPLKSAKGVINMKGVMSGPIIGPTSMIKFGLFHKFMLGSFTVLGGVHYTGSGLSQGLLRQLFQSKIGSNIGDLLGKS
jgi:hypothetical protein